MTLSYSNNEYASTINPGDLAQDRLLPCKQRIWSPGENGLIAITYDGYQLPGYESFSIRLYASDCWVLSLGGKLVTYGTYGHLVDVIMLLIRVFPCWNSETSLVHFLTTEEYIDVLQEIMKLRTTDHNQRELM